MYKAVREFGFGLLVACFVLIPIGIYGQDLGSSNGLFRAPNPTISKTRNTPIAKKPVSKSRTAPSKLSAGKKVVSKTTANPPASPSTAQNHPKPSTTGRVIQPNSSITVSKPPDIIIQAGDPLPAGNAAAYEQAIDDGNNARDERNYVTAENAYSRARSLKPDDARAFYGLGNIFSDQQRWEEAEKAYREAIKLDPNSPEAHVAISFVLTQPVTDPNLSDRYVEAEKMSRKAIQLDGSNAFAYDQLGAALELRGLIGAETEAAYRKAIQLDSKFAVAYAHLGRLLRRNGLVNESSAAYRDAIRLASDGPTMILVADVMQSQQHYLESEQLLFSALRDDPKNPTALFLLGRALTIRGSYDEAEKVLRKSVEVSPNSFVSYTLLSSLYARRNRLEDAESVLIRALTVVAPSERRRLSYEFQFVGDAFMKLGRNKDAVRLYQRAMSLDGDKALLANKLNKAQKS